MKQKNIRLFERSAAFGLIILAAALMVPITNLFDPERLAICKWFYAAGALIFATARAFGSTDRDESFRLRRLRRLEFWAGAAFIVGAAFWFYNEAHLGPYAGTLAVLRPTVLFSLAGAAIQIVAAFLISRNATKA